IERQSKVDHEHLADAPLMFEMAVKGVQAQAFDEHFAATNPSLIFHRLFLHGAAAIACATRSACTCGATSCTRKIAAPLATPISPAASEPASRSAGRVWPVNAPMVPLRDTPRSPGRPIAAVWPRRRISAR